MQLCLTKLSMILEIDPCVIELKKIVGKGEIASYEQFLLFPQCFQKLSVVDASK